MTDLTPEQVDLTRGVKFKTHRRQWGFNAFIVFNGCSLKGYACARARAYTTYLQRNRVKSVKRVNYPTPSCDQDLTPLQFRRQIGCKIVGWFT